MMVPCPNCGAALDQGELETGSAGRRMIRYLGCKCGAIVHSSMREGWERWYLVMWWFDRQPKDVHHTDESEAFYARLENRPPKPKRPKLRSV
jgi:hypothetical protein